MGKEEIFDYLNRHGYTSAAVDHPEFPRETVLEHLAVSTNDDKFKAYYIRFIMVNFSS